MAERNIRSFFVPALLQDTATEVGKLKKITLQLTQRIRKRQIASQSSQTQRLCVANACKACFSLSIVSNCDTNQFNDVTCNGNETLVHVCNYGCTIPVSHLLGNNFHKRSIHFPPDIFRYNSS